MYINYVQKSMISLMTLPSASTKLMSHSCLHQIWRLTLRTRGELRRIASGYLLINVQDYFTIYLDSVYIHYYTMYNIIQWNCRGLRASFKDFRLLYDNYNPIVYCLQETMLTKDDFIIRGFNCFM